MDRFCYYMLRFSASNQILLLPTHAQIFCFKPNSASANTCSDFFGVTMLILSYKQITIVRRFSSLSSYHLVQINSCATAFLLSKKLVRIKTPVRHTSLLVTAYNLDQRSETKGRAKDVFLRGSKDEPSEENN